MTGQNLNAILQSLDLDANQAPDMDQWKLLLELAQAESLRDSATLELAEQRRTNSANDTRAMDQVDIRLAELENAQKDLVAANSRLAYDAHHDALTGLYNRAFFTDIVKQKIQARTDENVLALMFIDFDGFKEVNDTLGHLVGDQLLIQISERLSKVIRKTDYLARMGGDEFTILVSVKERQHIEQVAQRIIGVFHRPVMIDGAAVMTSASIGISVDDDAMYDSAERMIGDADIAMYRAKHAGKGRFQIFDQSLRQEGSERIAKEQALERAILNEELFVVFQPIVDLETWKTTGAEVYIRWDHPERGTLSAQEFLPLAEDLGLIGKIDEVSLNAACHSLQAWKQQVDLGDFRLGINLSLGQLQRPDLIPVIWNALDAHDLRPSDLSIEIAETNLFLNESLVQQNIQSLDGLGIEILLDGFGTGYSSLSCFSKYRLHGIKIDRSLTNEIESDKASRELMQSILQLSETLNIKPTVEGVESKEQLAALREIGCRYAQGYLFAKPQKADEFLQTLQSNTLVPASD